MTTPDREVKCPECGELLVTERATWLAAPLSLIALAVVVVF